MYKKGAGSPTLHAVTNDSKALPASTSETCSGTSSPFSSKNIDKKINKLKDNSVLDYKDKTF